MFPSCQRLPASRQASILGSVPLKRVSHGPLAIAISLVYIVGTDRGVLRRRDVSCCTLFIFPHGNKLSRVFLCFVALVLFQPGSCFEVVDCGF